MKDGRIVIVAYRPLPGKAAELVTLAKSHVDRLKSEGLVSDRPPVIMQAADGTVVEVFEWKSKEAIENAHSNPAVQKMWGEFAEVCEYVPAAEVDELKQMFSEFKPVD